MTEEKNMLEDVLSSLNEVLDFKLCQIQDENYIIDLVQIGNEKINSDGEKEEDIHWVKCLFKSGKTYVYNKDDFINSNLKSLEAFQKSDLTEISKRVEKKRDVSQDNKLKESLDEAEKKERTSRAGVVKYKVQVETDIINEDDLKDGLGKIFDKWVSSIDVMKNSTGGFADSIRVFDKTFQQAYSGSLRKISNDEDVDTCSVVTINVDGVPAVFYNSAEFDKVSKKQIWYPGVLPIAFTGRLCSKQPKTVEDLQKKSFSLSNLQDVQIPSEDDEEIKFQKEISKDQSEA